MSFKLHLILALKPSVLMLIRCNFPDILYLSETQKNNFQRVQFLTKSVNHWWYIEFIAWCYIIPRRDVM